MTEKTINVKARLGEEPIGEVNVRFETSRDGVLVWLNEMPQQDVTVIVGFNGREQTFRFTSENYAAKQLFPVARNEVL